MRRAPRVAAATPPAAAAGGTGVVTRTTRVGFEVRAEVTACDEVVSVVVTRAEARTLGLAPGVAVRLSPAVGAPTGTASEPADRRVAEPLVG